jgi:hypothetical protein
MTSHSWCSLQAVIGLVSGQAVDRLMNALILELLRAKKEKKKKVKKNCKDSSRR